MPKPEIPPRSFLRFKTRREQSFGELNFLSLSGKDDDLLFTHVRTMMARAPVAARYHYAEALEAMERMQGQSGRGKQRDQ